MKQKESEIQDTIDEILYLERLVMEAKVAKSNELITYAEYKDKVEALHREQRKLESLRSY